MFTCYEDNNQIRLKSSVYSILSFFGHTNHCVLVADTPDVISLFVQELIIMFKNLQTRVDVSWQTGKKYEGTRVTAKSKRNEFIKKKSEYLPGRSRIALSAIQRLEQDYTYPLSLKVVPLFTPLKSLGTNATPEYYPN